MMNNFKNNIDRLVSKILNEEIEAKVNQLSKTINEGEWTEIEMDEELHGNQNKLDVAPPKGKITAADFKKLRDAKSHKKEVEEFFYYDTEDEDDEESVSFEDEDSDRKGFHVSRKPKMMGSFDDEHGWYDDTDTQTHPDAFDDYDEEEFGDYESFMSKHGDKQSWFGGNSGPKMFKTYQDKFGKPFRVRTPKSLDIDEEECNECGDKGMYESKGKKCPKCGMVNCKCNHKKETKEGKEKWIQDTKMNKGELHKKLGIPEGDKITNSKLQSLKKELMKKGEGDKKLSAADSKLLKQVNLALTLKSVKENVQSLKLTENELIDMIENIVKEQQVKDKSEKSNIGKKEPQGLKDTNKVLSKNKQENDSYAKEVVEKMKDYMKDMYMGEGGYDENPDDFPQSNYNMEKEHKEKKYNPSDAVEEYIEAFAYPGMTNLVYDEIKPDDEMIEKQIKGDSKNGNAVTGKDGKALGNVSKRSEKVGDRFKKNFDENLYGAEQQKGSYKRQSQPVDIAGDKKQSGSIKKGNKILNQLESTEDKKSKVILEEMNKMKNLIGYNRKTQ